MSQHILSIRKSLVSLLTIFALLLGAGVMIQPAFAQQKKLIAIMIPSPENPFFKALAEAADARRSHSVTTRLTLCTMTTR
jgi:ABC-type sugar transport system substrate-binding protein